MAGRTYTSEVRSTQARLTRRRVVDAAAELFAERGYGATTIDAVAERAHVSRKTVFDSVGGKATLMKLAYDFAVTGDDEPVPLAGRPVVAELKAAQDPALMLADFARLAATVGTRIAALYCALEQAAGADPEADALYRALIRQRRTGMQFPADELARRGELKPGLTADRAADLLWVCTDPALFDKLVRQQGWSVEAFTGWLAQTMQDQLLSSRP